MPNTLTRAPLTQTAVWGGGLARTTGGNGRWICIPQGHSQTVFTMGTDAAAPDTGLNPISTADDRQAVEYPLFACAVVEREWGIQRLDSRALRGIRRSRFSVADRCWWLPIYERQRAFRLSHRPV